MSGAICNNVLICGGLRQQLVDESDRTTNHYHGLNDRVTLPNIQSLQQGIESGEKKALHIGLVRQLCRE